MHGRPSFFLFFLLASVFACSVKEDRSGCPCILSVYNADADGKAVTVEVWNTEGTCLASDYVAKVPCIFKVPRGDLLVTAWTGRSSCDILDGELRIPKGKQMDELLSASVAVSSYGESSECVVSLHKQFATVSLQLKNFPKDENAVDVRVLGDICGFNIVDGRSLAGEFEYAPVTGADSLAVFRLPRQTGGDALRLAIGPLELPLGEQIARSGYDWARTDLDDIFVTVDYFNSVINLWISEWNEYSYEENF